MDQMAIRVRLETYLRIVAGGHSIWFGQEIPPKKLKAAIAAYAPGVVEDRVIALHDGTVFGKADDGFLVTDAAFYCRNFLGRSINTEIRFDRVRRTESVATADGRGAVEVFVEGTGCMRFVTSESAQDNPIGLALQSMFEAVYELRDEGLLTSEDRYVIVQDMSEEFRVEYVKMGVHLALMDDNVVSPEELAEIQLLMTRLELSPAARRTIWQCIAGELEPYDQVLHRLEQLAPKGAWPVLSLSLIKDLMVIACGRHGGAFVPRDGFIVHIAERYGINREKREFLAEAIKFDRAVLTGTVKAPQLKKMGTDLAARSAAVGVPLVAVYLSGSVVGLSAAGVTSGLAALGFGGLFGLSAMVTGIGAVILIGGAVYTLIRWLSGSEEKELAALRERLTQEVVKQLQRTVNALIGDIQLLTADVVELTRAGAIDQARIRRLAQEVHALAGAMSTLSKRTQKGRDEGVVLA